MQNELNQYRPAVEKVIDAVDDLNDSLAHIDALAYSVTLVAYGIFTYEVKFLDWVLYSTESDPREHDEETDTYEPLDVYLRRAINEQLSTLSKVEI